MPKKSLKKEIFNSEKTSLIVNETEFFLREFKEIKTIEQAKDWIKSFPDGFEKPLLFMLLLERIQNRV